METIGVRHGGVKHSLHILLKSLIDYAGLFPPSGLSMGDAIANYDRYRISPNAWADDTTRGSKALSSRMIA